MSLKSWVAGGGEGSIREGGRPRGQIWSSKGCGFNVTGEGARMGRGEIARPGSIQSAWRHHIQVWVEVIVGRGPWRSQRGGGWQEEASSRSFTQAQAHTDSPDLVVAVGWVLRGW